jgi:hypothetical protein
MPVLSLAYHEDVWGSKSIAPPFLTSALYFFMKLRSNVLLETTSDL